MTPIEWMLIGVAITMFSLAVVVPLVCWLIHPNIEDE